MHELTWKVQNALSQGGSYGEQETDSIITSYLREKANDVENLVCKEGNPPKGFWRKMLEILGLESEVRECEQCNNPMRKGTHAPWCNTTGFEKPVKEKMKCDHIVSGIGNVFLMSGYNFCPLCGVARPKQKSLAEKFRDWFIDEKSNKQFCTLASEKLAQIAEQHFKEEPKR